MDINALFWLVRADDGRRGEAPREESRECPSLVALRAAVRDAKASFRGENSARVEIWVRRNCGHMHLEAFWVWEHGAEGRWELFTASVGGVIAAGLAEAPFAAPPAPAEVPN